MTNKFGPTPLSTAFARRQALRLLALCGAAPSTLLASRTTHSWVNVLGQLRGGVGFEQGLHERVMEFEKNWGLWLLKAYGCPIPPPGEPVDIRNCRPTRGEFSIKLWSNARSAAKKLFNLKDGDEK